MTHSRLLPLLLGAALVPGLAVAQAPARTVQLDPATLGSMRWRQIGPANMSGRVTDVEGIPGSKTFYFAAAAGGIWKTTNNGTTFKPVFTGDDRRVISMGDIAIAPSDTNVIYAGTGEEDSRNSISPGGGVYKSTDGGKTWQFLGLEKTQAIGRIVVHPRDPNTVYVAAVGAIWNSNPERGLYKSTDGGKTWTVSKQINDRAGFVDIAMDPRNPDVLYASSWERVRGPYFLKSGGPGSALWKSTDAGATWSKIEGNGWPTTTLGRIGLGMSESNPDIIYAMVEADSAKGEGRLKNGLYKTTDAGKSWTKIHDSNTRPFYYSQVRVHPTDPNTFWFSSTPVLYSRDGGKTVGNATIGLHVDHHAMWIDPTDPDRLIVGNDGGLGISFDGGASYDFPNQFALGQFYEVSYDMALPYRVCGGLQDNGSWCGPSRRRNGTSNEAFWFTVNGGDGFYTQQDPTDPNVIYAESQGGRMSRIDYATGERTQLGAPSWRDRYTQFEDSILVERGDTTRQPTSAQRKRIDELRAQQKADSAALDMRFNWNTPFLLSPHNPRTFYAAGNRVLKSTNRGEGLFPISPDLSKQEWDKITLSRTTTGGITNDATGAEMYGTVVALAESYVRPGLLYAGTDDGNVWMTRNDGAAWENLTTRFPGLPSHAYVVRIEPSHRDTATFYVAFDHHRTGDMKPYVYMTTDFGRTFRSIAAGLPADGPQDFVHVVREDPTNQNLLYVGTDAGVFVSLDRGTSWQKFMTDLPVVPVHDLKIHPRDHELIAGTHGRSIWIVDVLPLQQLADSIMNKPAHLFAPKIAYQYGQSPALGQDVGHKTYQVASPPYGAEISYRVAPGAAAASATSSNGNGGNGAAAQRSAAMASIVITDAMGDTLSTISGPSSPGVHRVYWNFSGRPAPTPPLSPSQLRDSIVQARQMAAVFDSLAGAGYPKAMLDRVQTQMAGGGGFGRGFGGGGSAGASGEIPFEERPGETPARAVTLAGAAPAAAAARPSADMSEADVRTAVTDALRASGLFGRGRGGFRFGGGTTVAPGDYLVTLTVNGQTQKQRLRVERVSGYSGDAVLAEELEQERADKFERIYGRQP